MPDRHDEGKVGRIPSAPTNSIPEHTEEVTDGLRAQLFSVVLATAPIILMALDPDGIITMLEGRGVALWLAETLRLLLRKIGSRPRQAADAEDSVT